jgi:hypothetical protein
MMFKYVKIFSISTLALLVLLQSAFAEGFARLEQIKIYVRCEALLNTTAEVLSESEQEYQQHPLHKEAMNSRIVVLEFLNSGDFSDIGLGDLYLEYKTEFEDVFRKNENDPQRKQFLATLDTEISSCEGLNEMQKDIIDRSNKKQ